MEPRLRNLSLTAATLATAIVVILAIRRPPPFTGDWQRIEGAYVPQSPLLGLQIRITGNRFIVDGVEHPFDQEQYDRDAAMMLRDQLKVIQVAVDDRAGRLVLGVDREQALYEHQH